MLDTFPLPPECLRLILAQLAVKKELYTLATLLRVNKYICLATLPFIYENPFVWFNGRPVSLAQPRTSRVYSLVQLLLRFVPEESCTDLIKAVYETTLHPPPPQVWRIDYISYIRNYHSIGGNAECLRYEAAQFDPSPSLRQYMVEHQLPQKYIAQSIDYFRFPSDENSDDALKDFDSLDCLDEDVHRELTWSICQTILEQLQGIVIPLSDVYRYVDLIPRLSSLQTVSFHPDRVAGWFEHNFDEVSDEGLEMVEQRKMKRVEDLETVTRFVQAHTETFRGTLKQASILGTTGHLDQDDEDYDQELWFIQYPWSSPIAYQWRIMEYLPALIKPVKISNRNWMQFVAKSDQTSLAHITTIDVPEPTGPWYKELQSRPPFLHLCRSLKVYKMVSIGPESFKLLGSGADLPCLEHVSIHASIEPFGSELDDIGQSCGGTIQHLSIQGHQGAPSDTAWPFVKLGDGWKMPVLSKLYVQMGSERLIVDPDFLCHCPLLETLSLSDNHRTYNLNEIEVCQPTTLPKLTRLRLYGTAALSFHPDILHSTKELEYLVLGSPERRQRQSLSAQTLVSTVTRPVHSDYEDVVRAMFSASPRPQWTWNWFLPNLVSLDLSVGFALHFQFRMLQGCPNLRSLFLSIFSEEHRVERVLIKEDFNVVPTSDNTDQAETSPMTQIPVKDVSLHDLTFNELHEIQRQFMPKRVNIHSLLRTSRHMPTSTPASWETQREFEQKLSSDMMEGQPARQNWAFHPDSVFKKIDAQSQPGSAKQIQEIEVQVAQDPHRQPIVDKFLAEKRALREKERRETESQRQFRLAHPECLVVPSLKNLQIYGHWIISEEVLELMLSRVFRNIEFINEYQCEGFGYEAWLRITGKMPWLKKNNQGARTFDSWFATA